MCLFVLRLHLCTSDLNAASSLTFSVDLSRLEDCAPTGPTCMLFHSPVYIRCFCNEAEAGTFYCVAFSGAMFENERDISFHGTHTVRKLETYSFISPLLWIQISNPMNFIVFFTTSVRTRVLLRPQRGWFCLFISISFFFNSQPQSTRKPQMASPAWLFCLKATFLLEYLLSFLAVFVADSYVFYIYEKHPKILAQVGIRKEVSFSKNKEADALLQLC